MKQERDIKKIIFLIVIAFVMAACSTGTAAGPEGSLDSVGKAIKEEPAASAVKKTLVVYYSRTGNCRTFATALGSQLGADVEEMPSEKDRGIFTIIGEQYFGGGDKQKPFEKNLQDYSPIIVVAPIYLMKFSAPGRFFIKEVIPEGSEVYVITMTGGPPPKSAHKKIEKMATDSGLVMRGVHGFQAGKTQEEFDSEIKTFLKENPITDDAPEEEAQPIEPAAATEESEA